ncbi:Retrovirus-related Pol polyprotein from type-1 retrotransposable element R1 [Araneus ventricosus]|uniref:Retrovirus-related Pol polyprotein from type-1 retrotransposable element R1 n=1 Tax=Araneus ventricosus TaxID=182803 RepID=A0A4Y2MFD4_ARAVE|nr:Retrovirus-related Pol polyprotein from type-1 retrotransposable element R1 [Araneus ventricosus]
MYQVESKPFGIPSHCKLFVTQREKLKAGIIVFHPDLSVMKVFSATNTVGVSFPYRGMNLLLITVYCPPKEDLYHILAELETCFMLPYDRVLLTGDFNSKSPVWGSDVEDERGRQLMEFVLSKGLAIVNEEDTIPTFDGSRGRSWVDITISDPLLLDNIFKWKVDLEPTCSDHNSISFSLYTGKKTKPRKHRRFNLKNINILSLRSSLHSEIGNRVLVHATDLDKEVEDYVTKITSACKNSVQVRQPLSKKQRWWDRNLEILRSQVRRAKKKMYQARLPNDRKFLRQKFKKVEGEYKFKLLQAKREGWADTCEEVTTEQPFGVHFDVAKCPDKRHLQLSAVSKQDGSLTSTTEEALQVLLDFHFPSDPHQDSPSHASIRQQSKILPSTDNDHPFSPLELEAAVKNIRSKKAPGPDGLFGDIVKEAFQANKTYLLHLFNACLDQGHFPSSWKKADLVLFNKNNKKDTDPAAFRPICLLDALGKVLDRLVTQRIFHHLLKHKLLSAHQFGFTPGRSAPGAIIQLKDWIHMARLEKKHSVIISLDVKSAFSRVWWPLVLHNLKRMACPRNLYGIAASFLDGRSISLSYGDTVISKDYSIGCPQGSNSGPLYWLLIVNDALEMDFGEDVRILAYADDIYLFVAATGKQNIKKYAETALQKLQEWSITAKVEFAHEKTKLIPFGKKGKQKHPPYCSFNGRAIKLSRQLKILGVVLDDGLNFLPHIQYVRGKTLKILNRLTIARSRRGLSGRVVKMLYKRALERIIVYAAPAWWVGTANQRQKINRFQRQVLLAVTGAFRTTSTAALQVISGIEPADLVCEMEAALYQLKHNRPDPHFLGVHLESNQVERYLPSWAHPSTKHLVHWDQDSPDYDLGIFTDGSKLNGQVGAAFSVFDPQHSGDFQFRLDDHCSVFQAELTAIKQALLWKQQNRPHANCHLFTDSMSSLKALQKFAPKNNLVDDINSLLDGTISLHWVKAHIGVAGNEVADKAAKAASDRPSVDIHLGIPERSLKTSIRHLLLREWQDRWKDDNEKGRFTFNIFPEVKTNRCIDNRQLSQVVTNHGLCPYYLKKFNLRECNCRCGEDIR